MTDIIRSFKMYKIWGPLGLADLMQTYRFAALGPLWAIIQPAIWVAAISFFFLPFMQMDPAGYIIYVATGLVVFNHLSAVISEAGEVFRRNRTLITNLNLPLYFYVLKENTRIAIRTAFSFVLLIPILLYFQVSIAFMDVIFGLILLALFSLGVSSFLVVLATRFGDMSFMINSVMRLMFFVTPIVWNAEGATGARRLLVAFNPLYYLIEIVRQPLLGASAAPQIVFNCMAFTGGVLILGLCAFTLFKKNIPHWVV